jgi:LmbE family N-acetylglucosaminyl deacetylase
MTGTAGLTPISRWRDVLRDARFEVVDPTGWGRVLVVAAHPDDETLAAGGLMQALLAGGNRMELVVATDGEAAFPDAKPGDRDELRRTRRAELHSSMLAGGLGQVPVHWLGLPDSALDADELAGLLRPLMRDVHAYLAPWQGDPHPDHAAAGRAARAAAPVHAHGWGYPIWMWAWHPADDDSIPWSSTVEHRLTPSQREHKRRAIACFVSQLRPPPGGGDPVLPAEVLSYFDTDQELFFREPPPHSAPASRFDELYAGGDGDPWGTRFRWYEQRKRAVTLACLPRAHYRHAAEPGCGTGTLTRELAVRCDRLDSSDYSAPAVSATGVATADLALVNVSHLALPDSRCLPDGIDLAVLSEVLYYLSPHDVRATTDRLADALVEGGDVVLAHWRGWAPEAPQSAAQTHEQVRGDARFEVLVEHTDTEFLLMVLRRR